MMSAAFFAVDLKLIAVAGACFFAGRQFDLAKWPTADGEKYASEFLKEDVGQSVAAVGPALPAQNMPMLDEADAVGEDESDAAAPESPTPEAEEPVKKNIVLIGERHSGTNWITAHLQKCFGQDIQVGVNYTRFKHWFQEDNLALVPKNSAVVVAMFRDPYDWVEAMRVQPHHSPDHLVWHNNNCEKNTPWQKCASPMRWKDFVTKPWIGQRGPVDERIRQTPGGIDNTTMHR